jgi:lipopolysaccharide export system ATP-binding protein
LKQIRTQHLVKAYNKKRVVNDVNINVKQGEIVGLLGPNGAGKTTTFYMILGVIQPDMGEIYLEDGEKKQSITGVPMYMRARMGLSYLSQEPSIFRRLTVEENLQAVLEFTDLNKKDKAKRLEHLLEAESFYAVGRRAPACGNRKIACVVAEFYAFRRAFCRHRPDCRV